MVANQIFGQERIVRKIRGQQILVENDLAVGHQYGNLGAGETDAGGVALRDGVVVGESLQRAIEFSHTLEGAHVAGLLIEH